jgi:hypothetical protein
LGSKDSSGKKRPQGDRQMVLDHRLSFSSPPAPLVPATPTPTPVIAVERRATSRLKSRQKRRFRQACLRCASTCQRLEQNRSRVGVRRCIRCPGLSLHSTIFTSPVPSARTMSTGRWRNTATGASSSIASSTRAWTSLTKAAHPSWRPGRGRLSGPVGDLFTEAPLNLNDPYGQAVAIRHDFGYRGQQLYTVYAHMQAINVSHGQWVDTGEVIGYVGKQA